jgi:hypothetical protein
MRARTSVGTIGRGLVVVVMAAVMMGLWARPAAGQSTYFADDSLTLNGVGAWRTQEFTLSRRTTFALRFVSDYQAQCAIIPPSEIGNFRNNRAFRGWALFDRTIGTKFITLNPGRYFVGMRNMTRGGNTCRYELDYDLVVSGWRFLGFGMQSNAYVAPRGGKRWHEFVIQPGRRYYLDGANSGVQTWLIPVSELANFRAGRTFRYYPTYSGGGMDQPGLTELRLPAGRYALVFRNDQGNAKAVTYNLEVYGR